MDFDETGIGSVNSKLMDEYNFGPYWSSILTSI